MSSRAVNKPMSTGISCDRLTGARLFAEFAGTFFLVFTIGCNKLTDFHPEYFGIFSNAAVLMVSMYSFGSVSGAHLNPCISFAIFLMQRLSLMELGAYVFAQTSAAALAGFCYRGLMGKAFNLEPNSKAGFNWEHTLGIEIMYSFVVVFVMLNVSCTRINTPNQFYGLAIAFALVAGGFIGEWIGGGCYNPAVAFGIDISSIGHGFGWCFSYILYEFIGAIIAFVMFRIIRREEFGTRQQTYCEATKMLAEFLGTFCIVLTAGLQFMSPYKATSHLAVACCLMCFVYSLSSVSAAHFNPVVTLAVLICGRNKISSSLAIKYILTQVVASLLAATVCWTMISKSVPDFTGVGPKGQYGWWSVLLIEVGFTFGYVFTFLNVATVRTPLQNFYGLTIGFAVVAGGYAGKPISGGHMNPALSIGLDFAHWLQSRHPFGFSLWYTLFQTIGAVGAALAFFSARPVEYAKTLLTSYGTI